MGKLAMKDIARICLEQLRAYQAAIGKAMFPAWDADTADDVASSYLKTYVGFAMESPYDSVEQLHAKIVEWWVRAGWSNGDRLSSVDKTCPYLQPWAALSVLEQIGLGMIHHSIRALVPELSCLVEIPDYDSVRRMAVAREMKESIGSLQTLNELLAAWSGCVKVSRIFDDIMSNVTRDNVELGWTDIAAPGEVATRELSDAVLLINDETNDMPMAAHTAFASVGMFRNTFITAQRLPEQMVKTEAIYRILYATIREFLFGIGELEGQFQDPTEYLPLDTLTKSVADQVIVPVLHASSGLLGMPIGDLEFLHQEIRSHLAAAGWVAGETWSIHGKVSPLMLRVKLRHTDEALLRLIRSTTLTLMMTWCSSKPWPVVAGYDLDNLDAAALLCNAACDALVDIAGEDDNGDMYAVMHRSVAVGENLWFVDDLIADLITQFSTGFGVETAIDPVSRKLSFRIRLQQREVIDVVKAKHQKAMRTMTSLKSINADDLSDLLAQRLNIAMSNWPGAVNTLLAGGVKNSAGHEFSVLGFLNNVLSVIGPGLHLDATMSPDGKQVTRVFSNYTSPLIEKPKEADIDSSAE